jgi:hypothetical protein
LERGLLDAEQPTREATMFRITMHDNLASRTQPVENNPRGRTALIGPAAFAAALAVAAFIWLALEAANGRGWPLGLSALAFVLTAGLGVVWHSNARDARRLNAALDAHAGREIVRAQRWKELARARRASVGK